VAVAPGSKRFGGTAGSGVEDRIAAAKTEQ